MSQIEARPYSKDYEITDAMFGAFRSEGGARFFWVLFGWSTVLLSAVFLLTLPMIFRAYGALLTTAVDLENAAAENADEALSSMFGILGSLFGGFGLMMLGYFAVVAIIRAAFYRGYFSGTTGGAFPFRFGKAELRQFVVQLAYWSIFIFSYMLVIFLITFIVGFSVGLGVEGGGMVIVGILSVAAVIAYIVLMVYLLVSLAPAGALTALRGKTHFLAARKVTKNRFWALFGSLLVTLLIGYVVSNVMSTVGLMTGLAGLFSGGGLDALASDDPTAIVDAFKDIASGPGFLFGAIFAIVLTAAGSAFYLLFIAGPSAFFVRQWQESDPRDVFA